jgi:hypothetical protein
VIVSRQKSVVAEEFWIVFVTMTETLIGMIASIEFLVGTVPVWAALIAGFIPPTAVADTHILGC